ncbi:MAG: metal ABC transporter substrate-binding protein [Gemmatales bacterium]|nr:metal ABC transporter substrate-binding protein [Gemmatales bacterium]MDW8176866.1 metal ABC transporter substrate-binding protein [Gemmatales bacterium]
MTRTSQEHWRVTGKAACVALILAACMSGGCLRRMEGDAWQGTTKLRVLTTIVPLHCLAARLGEPHAEVRCLCITNGPHEFQPTVEEARLFNGAEVVIANGLGLEGFLVPMIRGSGRRDLRVIRAAEELAKRGGALIEVPGYEHHGHMHGPGNDPHVWLGLEEAEQLAEIICETLCEMRPENRAFFQQRLGQVRQRLAELRKLAEPLRTTQGAVVTAHDAFRYLGRSVFGPGYEERLLAVRGLHGEELSPVEFTRLVQLCREKNVRVLAVEPGSSPAILARLQESLKENLKLIELDPIETAEPAAEKAFYVAPQWYFERLEGNLRRLCEALLP